MLFHTWTFAIFFAATWGGDRLLRATRWRCHWLLAASCFFYGWWNPLYLGLIVYSTALDYWVVARMDGSRRRRLWLLVSVVNNLALLGFFKYARFVVENLQALASWSGLALELPAPDVLLPVGISFYTFQSMSYTIDFYRGEIERERSFVRFAAFVSFFPQLVAGPIERARALLPQLAAPAAVRARDLTDGLALFLTGLFKKVALANTLAQWVDPVWASPGEQGAPALLLATFLFAWQIYFDFSGYTDMARGVARVLGFRLMVNFRHPYLATSLSDFWRRWHVSLSSWFRDYVYVPLGGSRRGEARVLANVIATMLLSGLWHGAGWTYLAWGAIHGVGAAATRRLERSARWREGVPRGVKRTVVFFFVLFSWVFFRAETLPDALLALERIATGAWSDPRVPLLALALVAGVWGYQVLEESAAARWLRAPPVRVALAAAMIVWLALVPGGAARPFIYFQF